MGSDCISSWALLIFTLFNNVSWITKLLDYISPSAALKAWSSFTGFGFLSVILKTRYSIWHHLFPWIFIATKSRFLPGRTLLKKYLFHVRITFYAWTHIPAENTPRRRPFGNKSFQCLTNDKILLVLPLLLFCINDNAICKAEVGKSSSDADTTFMVIQSLTHDSPYEDVKEGWWE